MNQSKDKKSLQFFGKSNYTWMFIGAACIVIGMLLMSGGKSPNPDVFDANEVYREKYRDWETDRKSTRLNSSHLKLSRMPSSA